MTTILLIRHGETNFVKTGKMAGRTPGVHLNDKGKTEAQDLVLCLKEVPIKLIYSSPMERTLETAKPLSKDLGLKIIRSEGLIETDIGDWKGMEIKKARKLPEWKTVQTAPSRFRFPGGESFVDAQSRLVRTIEEIISTHDDKSLIACFSHADPIRLVIAYYLGMSLDHFQRLSCHTGSVSALQFSNQNVMIMGINLRNPIKLS
jgi:probable phosphomutase (TIGR03848 family)